ncbi:MAG: hypothetical protein ACRCXT_02195 [Paraclostridium sp.]
MKKSELRKKLRYIKVKIMSSEANEAYNLLSRLGYVWGSNNKKANKYIPNINAVCILGYNKDNILSLESLSDDYITVDELFNIIDSIILGGK